MDSAEQDWLRNFQEDLWRKRFPDMDQDVFSYLLDSHGATLQKAVGEAMKIVDGMNLPKTDDPNADMELGLEQIFEAMAPDKSSRAAKQKMNVVLQHLKDNRESLSSTQIGTLFDDDAQYGTGFRMALLPEEKTNPDSRNMFDLSYAMFIAFIDNIVPENFKEENKDRSMLFAMAPFAAMIDSSHANDESNDRLTLLNRLNAIGSESPPIAAQLRSQGHDNLARVADSFVQKASALSEEIVAEVREEMTMMKQWESPSPGNPSPQ